MSAEEVSDINRDHFFLEIIFKDEIPHCKECDGLVKPGMPLSLGSNACNIYVQLDIVFFGEKLPDRFGQCVSTVSDR
jgi:NAD-dependent SIR2 family protein deacetylase